jgi:hypothetical protein
MYLRCTGRIHGELIEDKDREGKPVVFLEVKCQSQRCGAKSGVVVLHRFRLDQSAPIETKKFADPTKHFNRKKKKMLQVTQEGAA